MYNIDDPTASPTPPPPETAGTEGYWTEGNPATGTPATLERASWFNMVQGELRSVVVAAGLTPSKTAYDQVLTAIRHLIASSASAVDLSPYARLSSPAFTGAPTAPTPAPNAGSQQIATVGLVQAVAVAAAGKILQIVSASTATPVTINTTTYTDTGLSCAITTKAANSTVLCLVGQHCGGGDSGGGYSAGVKVLRGAAVLATAAGAVISVGTSQIWATASINVADAPGAVGTYAYKTQVCRLSGPNFGSGSGGAQGFGGVSTMLLIEIVPS